MIYKLNGFVNTLYRDLQDKVISETEYFIYLGYCHRLYKCLSAGRGKNVVQMLINSYHSKLLDKCN